MIEEREVLLLTLLARSVVNNGGKIQAQFDKCMGAVSRDSTTNKFVFVSDSSALAEVQDNLSWAESMDAINYFIMLIKNQRRTIDSITFYANIHGDTGVTWRGLKVDMSFLRVVLMDDIRTLETTIERLSALIFAANDERLNQNLN